MRRTAVILAAALSLSTLGFVSSATATTPIAAPTPSVANPWVGQKFTLTGDTATPLKRSIELQYKSGSSWKKSASASTAIDGTYSFSTSQTAATRDYRVYAKTSGANGSLTSATLTVATRSDTVTLLLSRDGSSIVAQGVADPVVTGRQFRLQYKSGSSWKPLGDAVSEGADGTVKVVAASSGTRSYRLVGEPQDGSSGAVSPSKSFTFGPAKLGAHAIYVTTDSGKTPSKKGAVFPGTAVIDTDAPLRLETLSVRGNSTATKPKKPYKLKFESKQGPFGLAKDKTWILLANYLDRTYVRSDVAWDLADQMTGVPWNPKRMFTELYINGKYQGSYQLIQSIKIDKARVNINKKTGQIIEFDPHYVADGVPGFKGQSGQPFSFKDPDEYEKLDDGTWDPEGLSPERIAGMTAKIKQFEKVLYARDWSKADLATLDPADDWMTYLDIKSAIDYYLVKEFTKDQDADFYRSNYFYTNNYDPASPDKLIMGPLWDFDRSAGAASNEKTTIASPKGWWVRGQGSPAHNTNKIHWYTRLTKDPRFLDALNQRWAEKKSAFAAVSATGVDQSVTELGGALVAENDRVRWASYGSRYPAHTSSFTKEITWLKNWYASRYAWMDSHIDD